MAGMGKPSTASQAGHCIPAVKPGLRPVTLLAAYLAPNASATTETPWMGEPARQEPKLGARFQDTLFGCVVKPSEAGQVQQEAMANAQACARCHSAACLPAGLFEVGDVQQEARWAVQVYRGVLHALPASVRIWFGDLRDKAMASAFEVSCIFLGGSGAPPTCLSTAQAQQMHLVE